uniref:Uncharacterized protein n=1 Tax=Arundo donax TaxID=35708 RepID=A0A0A9SS33_ARUDO
MNGTKSIAARGALNILKDAVLKAASDVGRSSRPRGR